MPFLTIAGIEVDVVEMAENESLLIGDEERTYNGTLRGNIDTEKRIWQGTGLEVSRVDYEALRSAVMLGAHVVVSGDSLPGSPRTMRVRLQGSAYVREQTGYLLIPAFVLEDV